MTTLDNFKSFQRNDILDIIEHWSIVALKFFLKKNYRRILVQSLFSWNES